MFLFQLFSFLPTASRSSFTLPYFQNILRHSNRGQLDIADHRYSFSFQRNSHSFRYTSFAHLPSSEISTASRKNITVACTNVDSILKAERFNVALSVSYPLLQATAGTIYVQEIPHIICDFNIDAKLFFLELPPPGMP